MKPPIPPVPPSSVRSDRAKFDASVKETLEILVGVRNDLIQPLPSNASLASVIAKVNEIIARLQ